MQNICDRSFNFTFLSIPSLLIGGVCLGVVVVVVVFFVGVTAVKCKRASGTDFLGTCPMFRLGGHPTNVGHQRWIELEATPTFVTIESFHTRVSHKSTNLNSTCVRCTHWNTKSTNKHSLVQHSFSRSSAHPENAERIRESQLIHVHVEATTTTATSTTTSTTTTTRKRTPPLM